MHSRSNRQKSPSKAVANDIEGRPLGIIEIVGGLEGVALGRSDGFWLGREDGSILGLLVTVGSIDGSAEGRDVGLPLGSTVKWIPPPQT